LYSLASAQVEMSQRDRGRLGLDPVRVPVVDPYDEETAAMWREHFGFRPSSEARTPKRLWLPLQPVD
jgi:hypothetical protein